MHPPRQLLPCRHAKSQGSQVLGQALGLPLCMAAFTFTGLAVTSATQAIFGRIISDPVELLAQLQNPLGVALGLLGGPWLACSMPWTMKPHGAGTQLALYCMRELLGIAGATRAFHPNHRSHF